MVLNIKISSSLTEHDSQTGRAHLLLVSNTPGLPYGAIGVLTLEGWSLFSHEYGINLTAFVTSPDVIEVE